MAEILEFVNDSVFSLIGLAEPELYTLSADANNSDILDDGRIIFYPNNGRNNQMRKFWRTRTCKKTKLGPRPCGSGETTPRSDMKDNAERREG